MKMRHTTVAVVASSLAFGAGWLLGEPGESGDVMEPPSPRQSSAVPRKWTPAAIEQPLVAVMRQPTPALRVLAAVELAESLSDAEVREWYRRDWVDVDPPSARLALRAVLEARWLAADPEGLVKFQAGKDPGRVEVNARRWARAAPEAALAAVSTMGGPSAPREAAVAILAEIGRTAPGEVIKVLTAEPATLGIKPDNLAGEVLRELVRSHAELLREAREGFPPELRRVADHALIGHGLKNSEADALRELGERVDRTAVLPQLITGDPELCRILLDDPGRLPAEWYDGRTLAALADGSPERWFEPGRRFPGAREEDVRNASVGALFHLGRSDADAGEIAAAYHSPLFSGSRSGNRLFHVLSEISRRSEGALEDFLATLTDPEEFEQVEDWRQRSAEFEEARKPLTPEAWLESYGGDSTSRSYQHMATSGWGRREWDEASEGFAKLPDDRKRDIISDASANAGMPFTFRAKIFADYLNHSELARQGGDRREASSVSELVVDWFEDEPDTVSDWVAELPPGYVRTEAAVNVVRMWDRRIPEKGRQWLAGFPPDEQEEIKAMIATLPR